MINQQLTKITVVRVMKDDKQSTKSGLTALLVLATFGLLIGLSTSMSGSELNSQNELSARCRSLGGEIGSGKCFKNGRKV